MKNKIKAELSINGKNIQWLVDKLKMPRSTFYRKCETGFSVSEKMYISQLLGVESSEFFKEV